jgi:tryptophan-rich sensory protein
MGFARWAMVTVPAILFLGFLSGKLAGPSGTGRWYQELAKPAFQPPTWAFPVAWSLLYILLGLALAMILNARGAKGRGLALGLFAVQMLLNLLWSPLFFGAHQVSAALILLLVLFVLATACTYAFSKIRKVAGWLMLPYLAWLAFASVLNFEVDRLNPDAETFVPAVPQTEVIL